MKTIIQKLNLMLRKLFFKFTYKKEREYLFIYLSQGIKNGLTTISLLESILESYKKKNDQFYYTKIKEIISYMQNDGLAEAEAFYKANMIDKMESKILESADSLDHGFEDINTQTKNKNNFNTAIIFLFFPALLVSFGYIIFQPELKFWALKLVEPVSQYSTSQIPIPEYFEDRTAFIIVFLSIVGIMLSTFMILNLLKKYYTKYYFYFIVFAQREFIINTFNIIYRLKKIGFSLIEAIDYIIEETKDKTYRKIYIEFKEHLMSGENNIHVILEKYYIDDATISYLRSGEMNNSMDAGIKMLLDYNEYKYNKTLNQMIKYLPFVGEIIMTLILLKPLLDLILLSTIGVMDFTIF